MNRMRLKNRRGVTITEVVIASFIFLILLTGLIGMSMNALSQWSHGSSKVGADTDAMLAMQKLTTEIRTGTRASVASGGGTLALVMPSVNAQGDYDRFTEGATVYFYVSNGKLWRLAGGNAVVIAKKVNWVSFAVNGSQVQIRTNSRQQIGTKIGDTTLTTQVSLRNEPPQ
jgi:Tfp pilus assembly protein PilV